ncbi:hypothetical protein NIES4102_12120 [Chondrocystis sp. NIES-4102]|nr:hypothetical protein NIES4102_12120 [Chondrocystis sp. NIES-4102]
MATFNVINSNDSGAGSLRQAIIDANSTPGLDTINLSGNVTLTTGINITDSLIITGTNSVITQTGLDRLFKIDNAATSLIDVTFNNLTLTGGRPVEIGGAVYTVENLTLNNVVVQNNATTKRGGGVYSEGATLVINDSIFRNNTIADGATSAGGAIYNMNGTLTIDDSVIESNKSLIGVITSKAGKNTITDTIINNNSGSGIYLTSTSEIIIDNTQITNNTINIDQGIGGGIGIAVNSKAVISNSVISGNKATYGGGIFIGDTDSTAEIIDTKITNNVATTGAGGIGVSDNAAITIKDTLISGNTAPSGSGLETFTNGTALLTNVDINNNTGSQNQLEGDNITVRTSNNKGLQLGHIHRFYQQEKGFHLYTSDNNEVNTIKGKSLTGELKYKYESEKFSVLTSNKDITGATIAGAEEVYRFFNKDTGAHIYTMDEAERQNIYDNLKNYQYEGIKFYAFETAQADLGTIPVYRMYNSESKSHLFTSDANEINYIQNNLPNFSMEGNNGVAFHVMEL